MEGIYQSGIIEDIYVVHMIKDLGKLLDKKKAGRKLKFFESGRSGSIEEKSLDKDDIVLYDIHLDKYDFHSLTFYCKFDHKKE